MASLAPTRRSVVRAAAWSLPAVAVAAQAPAFAASQSTDFAFLPGATAVEERAYHSGGVWFDLAFRGASIRAGASGIAAGTLTLTLTWLADPGQADDRGCLEFLPVGWTSPDWSAGEIGSGTPVVFAWAGAVPPGEVVALEDGFWIGANKTRTFGTYRVQVAAPGETPVGIEYRWEGPAAARHSGGAGADAGATKLAAGTRS